MWGNMIIKSIYDKTIYQSNQRTIKAALEEGVQKNIDFSFADFRHAKLSNGNYDGLIARKASFWAADLDGADIGLADLRGADMRCASLKDSCLAETALSDADLKGAYFSRTIIDGAVLDRISVSCPSFWSLDLATAASFDGAVFSHLGEADMALENVPWIIDGPQPRLVIEGGKCLSGSELYTGGKMPPTLERSLFHLKFTLEKLLCGNISHNAANPILKRVNVRCTT